MPSSLLSVVVWLSRFQLETFISTPSATSLTALSRYTDALDKSKSVSSTHFKTEEFELKKSVTTEEDENQSKTKIKVPSLVCCNTATCNSPTAKELSNKPESVSPQKMTPKHRHRTRYKVAEREGSKVFKIPEMERELLEQDSGKLQIIFPHINNKLSICISSNSVE